MDTHLWLWLYTVLSHSVVSDSLWVNGLQHARFLGPWEFSRLEYWSGLPCPSPGDLPNTGIKPRSPALQADSLSSEPPRKPTTLYYLWITVPSPTPNLLVLTAAIKRLALSLIIHFLEIICLFSLVCFHVFSLFHVCQFYHVSRPGFLWIVGLPGQWLVLFISWGKFPAIISLNTIAASFHHIFCF